MSRTRVFVVVAIVFASLVRPQAQDNPQAPSGSWRPTIVAQHGMVAAGHPLAAEAGLILKAGGNAVDAAIARWAVQGEVEPGMTGLGADMFILYYNAKTGEVKFINGTGVAAQAATIDFYKSKGGIPDEGPLSSSVPGAVGGAAYAVQKYGTKPLADVLAPAIEIADGGVPISESLAGGLRGSRTKLAKHPSSTKIWFKDGKPLEQPAVISNSFRDSYQPHDVKGKLLTPAMLPQAVKDGLAARGHQLDIRNVKGVGSVKAILIDPRTGVLMGGVSPTGDSYVMAW